MSISDVQKVLQNLLREKVSVRHLEAMLETLADVGRQQGSWLPDRDGASEAGNCDFPGLTGRAGRLARADA
ncbi:MAG TPA: FHIPEP family type III secretion protein [Pseudoduganella sp.]